jgi:heat shock protein HtpX
MIINKEGGMSLLRLKLTTLGTLALIIGLSTLFFTIILSAMGTFNIISLSIFVLLFNLLQWLLAPKIIDTLYKTKEASRGEYPKLYTMVEELSRRMGLKMPRLMVAEIPIPNAFAYGSPLGGNRVAVTRKLLQELEEEEVEAVIGHELGHLKHRDVQIMMFVSVLPAIFYFIGYSLMLSGMFGGFRRGQAGAAALAIGLGCMLMYWILTMFVLGLSRQREYYADKRSVINVMDGRRKLSEALAKIVASSSRFRVSAEHHRIAKLDCFKSLFINDPDRAAADEMEIVKAKLFRSDEQLVRQIVSRRLTLSDHLAELFSTHPNIVKRLRALQKA